MGGTEVDAGYEYFGIRRVSFRAVQQRPWTGVPLRALISVL